MDIKKKAKRILSDILIVLLLVGMFFGGYFVSRAMHKKDTSTVGDIARIMQDAAYIVDPITGEAKEITEDDIADAIVNGLLDDYSAYYTKEEYEQILKERTGAREGVGLSFYRDEGGKDLYPVVFKVYGNSPAERAGFLAGDRITYLQIEGKESKKVTGGTVIEQVMGELKMGQKISITFEREGEQHTLEVVKEQFETAQVTYYDNQCKLYFSSKDSDEIQKVVDNTAGMTELDDKTAYIKLESFEDSAVWQLKEAFAQMQANNKEKLIFDLRDNGGGKLNVLLEIASYFIYNEGQEQSLVVYAQKKKGTEEYFTPKNNFLPFIKEVFVLANGNTASASEALIGAMLYYGEDINFDQDHIIIEGAKDKEGIGSTFGKGVMQTTYELENGGAVKFTTGKIMFPDKKTCINKVGIRATKENSVDKDEAVERVIEIMTAPIVPEEPIVPEDPEGTEPNDAGQEQE
ncbi:MAG: PDZ domain-containing protein [Clostridia bacterium]|nr:PDZ domain-containing protein [Clostridia bacterium]